MALTYTQITAITENTFIKKLPDGIYGSNALIKRMTRPDKLMLLDGGNSIIAPVINSKPTSGKYFTDADTLDITKTDNITGANFAWKQLYEPIRITRREMLQNSGDAAKLQLVASKVKIAEKQMKESLAIGIYSDGTAATGALTTNQITGLAATISTSVTYGGIAVADFAEWIAVSVNNSSTNRALSLNLMQQTYGQCSFDDDKPTVAVCKQNVFDQVWALFQPHQRLMSQEMADLGFPNVLSFNGIPVLIDSHMADNKIYFLNENYLFLAVHKDENLRKETIEKLETSNSMLMRIFWMGNLVCNGRRYQGELADIEVAS